MERLRPPPPQRLSCLPRGGAFSGRPSVPQAPPWPSDLTIADPRAPIATPNAHALSIRGPRLRILSPLQVKSIG
jgi:hypothetical protein